MINKFSVKTQVEKQGVSDTQGALYEETGGKTVSVNEKTKRMKRREI